MAQPGIITRSAHPANLWPGIKLFYGLEYKKFDTKWTQIFDKKSSDKAYEIVQGLSGFGLAPIKSEGAPIQYDTDGEGIPTRFTHVVYGLGWIVTREAIDDDQYDSVASQRTSALAYSMNTTTEIVHANVLNRAFDTNYPIGDGQPLISANHPSPSGVFSNLLPAADLSETSLEDGLKRMMQAKNARGLNIAVTARRLIVSTADVFNAQRILGSTLRVGTPNNDINALKSMGSIPEVISNPYLTDFNAWFIQTNVPNGLLSFWRREPDMEKDNDFDTENARAKSVMRFAAGAADPLAIFGSPGST